MARMGIPENVASMAIVVVQWCLLRHHRRMPRQVGKRAPIKKKKNDDERRFVNNLKSVAVVRSIHEAKWQRN